MLMRIILMGILLTRTIIYFAATHPLITLAIIIIMVVMGLINGVDRIQPHQALEAIISNSSKTHGTILTLVQLGETITISKLEFII